MSSREPRKTNPPIEAGDRAELLSGSERETRFSTLRGRGVRVYAPTSNRPARAGRIDSAYFIQKRYLARITRPRVTFRELARVIRAAAYRVSISIAAHRTDEASSETRQDSRRSARIQKVLSPTRAVAFATWRTVS